MDISEKDWKLFKTRIADWQERYMKMLNEEYINILSSDNLASEKFWTLQKRINKDKHRAGVCIE